MKIKDIVEIIETYHIYRQEIISGYPRIPIDIRFNCVSMPTENEIEKYRATKLEEFNKWLEREL